MSLQSPIALLVELDAVAANPAGEPAIKSERQIDTSLLKEGDIVKVTFLCNSLFVVV